MIKTRVVNKDILLKNKAYDIFPVELWSMDLTPQEFKLCVYIASKPSDWNFAFDRIAKAFNIDNKTAKRWLKAIEKKGILERIKNTTTGRADYILSVHRVVDDSKENTPIPPAAIELAKDYMLFIKTQSGKKGLINEDDEQHAREFLELVRVDGASLTDLKRVIRIIKSDYLEFKYWDISDTKKLRVNFEAVHKKALELDPNPNPNLYLNTRP